jgi:hypothetical protein
MTPPIEVIEKKLKQNGVHRFFVRIMKLDKHVIEACCTGNASRRRCDAARHIHSLDNPTL